MVKNKKILSGLLFVFLYVTVITSVRVKADEEEVYSPLLIVNSYKVSNDIITPGEQFELIVEIENTDKKTAAHGVLVNLNFPDGMSTVYPTLPQAYLKSIEPESKEKVIFQMKASSSYSKSTALFAISIVSSDRTNSTYIYAPVKTDTSSFKIISKSLPMEVYAGEKISAAVTFKSLIDDRLSNVTFQIFVDEVEEAVYTANIGNISAEASKTQNIVFKLDEKGNHLVRAVLSYSINGEKFSSDELFSGTITVSDASQATETLVQEAEDLPLSSKDKMIIFGCIGASLVLFIGIVVIAKKYN